MLKNFFAIYVQQGYKENIRNSRVIYGVILEFQSVSGHLTVFIFPKKFIDITISTYIVDSYGYVWDQAD